MSDATISTIPPSATAPTASPDAATAAGPPAGEAPAGSDASGALPERLTVHRWPDPVLDTMGHDPRSPYVERFWLPILGPSAIWLLRHLAAQLDEHPDGVELDSEATARALGVGTRGGRQSPFARTVERVVTFGFAQQVGPAVLHVRHRLPPLTRRQVLRLPVTLQRDHELWLEREADESPGAAQRRRARALALSLLQLGESVEAAERQLHRWRFHPAIAFDAIRWAQSDEAARLTAATTHAGPSPEAPPDAS